MWIGFSRIWTGFSSCCTSIASSSPGSSSIGVPVGVGVGVGVVACFTYQRSCGSSPAPTSEQVFSNMAHPSATNLWPRNTVRTAEINKIIKYMYLRHLQHEYYLKNYIRTLHLRPLRHVYNLVHYLWAYLSLSAGAWPWCLQRSFSPPDLPPPPLPPHHQ